MHKSIFVCHRKLRTNLEIILLEVDSCTKYCTKPHSTTIPHHTINVAHNLSQPTRMLRQRLQPYVLLTNLIVYWPWSYSYFILTTYLHRLWSPSIPYLHSYLPNRVWLEVHNFLTPKTPFFIGVQAPFHSPQDGIWIIPQHSPQKTLPQPFQSINHIIGDGKWC